MTSPLICNICKQENEPDSLMCSNCGARLAPVKTVKVSGEPPIPKSRDRLIPEVQTTPGTISLYIPVEREPVSVQAKEKLVIGRYFKGASFDDDPKPDIDLAQYDAHLLGVSRIHAMITLDEEGYSLQDLSSRNGTWVNARRLEPNSSQRLNSGDLIRLGHFLMFIYFGTAQLGQISSILRLVEKGQLADFVVNRGATLGYITRSIMPLLRSVVELQRVINEMTKRVAADANILSIDFFTKESYQVEIHVDGVTESVRFIEKYVAPWKSKYIQNSVEVPAVLQQFRAKGENGSDRTESKLTTQLMKAPKMTMPPHRPATSPLPVPHISYPDEEIETGFRGLVDHLISDFAPRQEAASDAVVMRVTPILYSIISSSLDIL
jgi:pSer/pThr/pTyr-binding forkhead associated (FHA) protein